MTDAARSRYFAAAAERVYNDQRESVDTKREIVLIVLAFVSFASRPTASELKVRQASSLSFVLFSFSLSHVMNSKTS